MAEEETRASLRAQIRRLDSSIGELRTQISQIEKVALYKYASALQESALEKKARLAQLERVRGVLQARLDLLSGEPMSQGARIRRRRRRALLRKDC